MKKKFFVFTLVFSMMLGVSTTAFAAQPPTITPDMTDEEFNTVMDKYVLDHYAELHEAHVESLNQYLDSLHRSGGDVEITDTDGNVQDGGYYPLRDDIETDLVLELY